MATQLKLQNIKRSYYEALDTRWMSLYILFRLSVRSDVKLQKNVDTTFIYPVDTWHKLNRHKIIKWCPGHHMKVLCTFYFVCVPMGMRNWKNVLLIPHILYIPNGHIVISNYMMSWTSDDYLIWVPLRLCVHRYIPDLLS